MTTRVRPRRDTRRGHRYDGAEGFAPDPKPKINARTVVCADCAAPVGDMCRSSDGEPHSWSHKVRIRLATRLANDVRHVSQRADQQFVKTIPPAERRSIRKAAGLTQRALAAELKIGETAFRDLENGVTYPTTTWSAHYGAWLRERKAMTDGVTFTEALAGEIRARMGRRGLNGSALSKATGMANATLARKLKGETPFTTVDLEVVAKVLGTSVAGLVLSVRESS